jgi:hypothetical protein
MAAATLVLVMGITLLTTRQQVLGYSRVYM